MDTAVHLPVAPDTPLDVVVDAVRVWIDANVPRAWVDAGRSGGAAAIRAVRTRAAYEDWYPVFAASGLVVPTWPVAYGGLDLAPATARAVETELRPFNLGRLNPLGLNLAAPALFAHGTEAQRLRYLPPIVRNEEIWCQLFSEPGAGSDLASLATRADRDGDHWVVTGQKVWTTWAHLAGFGVLLARTDPDIPKRQGITYFLLDLHQPGVDVRPLRHITGEVDFNEVFLDRAVVPDDMRVGAIGDGWKVANATLSGERQMVSGAGSGGVDRIGGRGADHVIELAARSRPRRRPARPSGAHAALLGGAHPRLDEPARARAGEGGPFARAGELGGQGPPRRSQPAGPAPRRRSARRRRDRAWRDAPEQRVRRSRCRPRCAACCGAGPTRSRAAPPR